MSFMESFLESYGPGRVIPVVENIFVDTLSIISRMQMVKYVMKLT